MQLVTIKPTIQMTWAERGVLQEFVDLIDELEESGVAMDNDDVYELLLDLAQGNTSDIVSVEMVD